MGSPARPIGVRGVIGRPPVRGRSELFRESGRSERRRSLLERESGRSERGRSLLERESGRSERGRSELFLESGRDDGRPEPELEGGRELLDRLGGLSTIESPHPWNS
ncbi:MAG: hypothetical protein D4R83_08720 [Streptomycetaceae bacterium]|nr:MAG: hypothetical protein D4R83_08720 [Streptomycetaceae bacterium]